MSALPQTSASVAAMTDLTHEPDCDVILCYGGAKLADRHLALKGV